MGNKLSAGEQSVADQTANSKRKPQKKTKGPTIKKKVRPQKSNNPPTAYALFIRDVRNQMFDIRVNFIELVVSCAQKWREMPSEEKERYLQMAKEIRENMVTIGGPAKRRCLKERPKGIKTNYWKFGHKMRPIVKMEMEDAIGSKPKMIEVNKEIGRRWQQLTKQQKKEFNN